MNCDSAGVKALLDHGQSPNVLVDGQTPLELSVRLVAKDIFTELLEHGADPNFPAGSRLTVLHRASAARDLLDQGAYYVRELVAHGADVNARTADGITPLMEAAQNGSLASAVALIQNEAALDASDDDGQTALMKGASHGRASMVKLLLEAGANPCKKDKHDKRAMDYALASVPMATGAPPDAPKDRAATIELLGSFCTGQPPDSLRREDEKKGPTSGDIHDK
jgi:ankyrin repeat protein